MKLTSLVDFKAGEAVKNPIFSNSGGTMVLLALDKGASLPIHTAPADAVVLVLEGKVDFTLDMDPMKLETGDFLMMRKGQPHTLTATEPAKIQLTLFKED